MTLDEIRIILVEDDRVDAEAVRRTFRRRRIRNRIDAFSDGVDALRALRGDAAPAPAEPFLILLDLNMPRMNGLDFLAEIRRDPNLKHAVVFILTTSNDERDRTAASKLGIAGYIVKTQLDRDLPEHLMLDSYSWALVQDRTKGQ